LSPDGVRGDPVIFLDGDVVKQNRTGTSRHWAGTVYEVPSEERTWRSPGGSSTCPKAWA
jgi:hypothetical protein